MSMNTYVEQIYKLFNDGDNAQAHIAHSESSAATWIFTVPEFGHVLRNTVKSFGWHITRQDSEIPTCLSRVTDQLRQAVHHTQDDVMIQLKRITNLGVHFKAIGRHMVRRAVDHRNSAFALAVVASACSLIDASAYIQGLLRHQAITQISANYLFSHLRNKCILAAWYVIENSEEFFKSNTDWNTQWSALLEALVPCEDSADYAEYRAAWDLVIDDETEVHYVL